MCSCVQATRMCACVFAYPSGGTASRQPWNSSTMALGKRVAEAQLLLGVSVSFRQELDLCFLAVIHRHEPGLLPHASVALTPLIGGTQSERPPLRAIPLLKLDREFQERRHGRSTTRTSHLHQVDYQRLQGDFGERYSTELTIMATQGHKIERSNFECGNFSGENLEKMLRFCLRQGSL